MDFYLHDIFMPKESLLISLRNTWKILRIHCKNSALNAGVNGTRSNPLHAGSIGIRGEIFETALMLIQVCRLDTLRIIGQYSGKSSTCIKKHLHLSSSSCKFDDHNVGTRLSYESVCQSLDTKFPDFSLTLFQSSPTLHRHVSSQNA